MTVSIRSLGPSDAGALIEFFAVIASDDATVALFHPHDFDAATADRICNRRGIDLDEYFAAFEGEDILAYGMLRGWDEGYETPSFGVCVHPLHRGEGLGSRILDHAISIAGQRGSTQVMLKVFRDNAAARRLYESRGFIWEPGEGEQLVGLKSLA